MPPRLTERSGADGEFRRAVQGCCWRRTGSALSEVDGLSLAERIRRASRRSPQRSVRQPDDQPQQSIERRPGVAAAVPAEDELVEVALEVRLAGRHGTCR